MTAATLISKDLIPIRTSDTGRAAMLVMADFNVRHLPVVNNKELLGVISEENLLNTNLDQPIGAFEIMDGLVAANETDHLFEVMALMVKQQLSTIPVVDHEMNYLGVINHSELLRFFADSHSLAEPGTILLLNVSQRKYSLAEISRILEEAGATILCSFLTDQENDVLKLSLKISTDDVSGAIKELARYDYHVEWEFEGDDYDNIYEERYNSLLHFLDI